MALVLLALAPLHPLHSGDLPGAPAVSHLPARLPMSRAAPFSSLVAAFARPRPRPRPGPRPQRGAIQRSVKAWGGRAAQRLRAMGLDIDRCRPTDQGVDFEPDGRLGLAVTPEQIELTLTVPLVELARARARLADASRASALMAAIAALPEQFELGASGDPSRVPASRATADDLAALFDRAAREQRCVWLGWIVPREIAVAHAASIDEQLEDALVALGSVLGALGRAPVEAERREPRRDRRDHSRPDDEIPATRRRARARSRDRELETDRDAEVVAESAAERDPPPPRLLRSTLAAGARKPLRAGVRRATVATLEKGSRVRVLEGPFAGKIGVVHELDGKGGARVMLGLLAVRVDVKDLGSVDEGRSRLRLGSSHRKPLPVRS